MPADMYDGRETTLASAPWVHFTGLLSAPVLLVFRKFLNSSQVTSASNLFPHLPENYVLNSGKRKHYNSTRSSAGAVLAARRGHSNGAVFVFLWFLSHMDTRTRGARVHQRQTLLNYKHHIKTDQELLGALCILGLLQKPGLQSAAWWRWSGVIHAALKHLLTGQQTGLRPTPAD